MSKPNYENVAFLLLTCSTQKEAAERSGLSEVTLYPLRKNDCFKSVLQKVKGEIFNDAMQKSQGYCLEALEVLRVVMNDSNATDSSRVSAARSVLELGLAMHEDENIIQRLTALERLVEVEHEKG